MDHRKRFVARAEAGRGWRIWNKQHKRPRRIAYRVRLVGPVFDHQPDAILAELNDGKRPERLAELLRLR